MNLKHKAMKTKKERKRNDVKARKRKKEKRV